MTTTGSSPDDANIVDERGPRKKKTYQGDHPAEYGTCMYPPPHMACMYPPPHMTCMYPPPHMTSMYPPPHMTCMYPPPHRHHASPAQSHGVRGHFR